MIVYGGYAHDTNGREFTFDDAWVLSFSGVPTWSRMWPAGMPPQARFGHTAVYDPSSDAMVVFGGEAFDSNGNLTPVLDDVWMLMLRGMPAWSRSWPGGMPPVPRAAHVAVYDPLRDCMVAFGGFAETNVPFDDTWALWSARLVDVPGVAPVGQTSLGLCRPNPARDGVTIPFALARPTGATLRICDLAGRVVRTLVAGDLAAGGHTARWDGRTARGVAAAPGIYFYELQAGGEQSVKRLVLLR
jgi:hypothetical protein